MRRVALMALAVALAGCSQLQVEKLSSDQGERPLVGKMTYFLPRSVVTVTGTAELTKCDARPDPNDQSKSIPDIGVKTTLSSSITSEPDPDQHYAIDYSSAQSWMKEINYQVTNTPDGTLQDFNGTINDQAGPVIVAAIGAAAQIGSAGALGGVPKPALLNAKEAEFHIEAVKPNAAPVPKYCNDDILQTLKDIKTLNADIKALKAKKLADPDKGAATYDAAIQDDQSQVSAKEKSLSQSFVFRWTPKASDHFASEENYWVTGQRISITPLISRSWLTVAGQKWLRASHKTDKQWIELTAPYWITLAMSSRDVAQPNVQVDAIREAGDGLVVRQPVTALMRLCHSSDANCRAPGNAIPAERTVVNVTKDTVPRTTAKIAQFGQIELLPAHSGLFDNANLTTSLASDGTITKIGYHSTSSVATGISGVGTAATYVSTGISNRNAAIAAANTAEGAMTTAKTAQVQAPDTYNKSLADCLNNANAVRNAGGTPQACQ